MQELAQILRCLSEGIVAADVAGRFLYFNDAAQRLIGLGPAEVSPEAWSAHYGLFDPETGHLFDPERLPLVRALRGERCEEVELLVRNANVPGGVRLSVTATPVLDDHGRVQGGVVLLRDLTRRHAEQAAVELERRLASMVQAIGAASNEAQSIPAILQVAVERVCATVPFPAGHAWVRGEVGDKLSSAGIWHLADGARLQPFRDATARLAVLEDTLPCKVARTGAIVWMPDLAGAGFHRVEAAKRAGLRAGVGVPVRVGDRVMGVLEFFCGEMPLAAELLEPALEQVGQQASRVFERHMARRREAFVQAVIDHVADPIFVKDRAFRFVFLSRALCDMVGHGREDMIGRTDYDFFPREQADWFRARDTEMFETGGRVVIEEEPITDAKGRLHWLATTKVPLRFGSGEVTHLVGVIHDITRLKEAEEGLRRKNDELAEQIAVAREAMAKLDVANRELEAFGYSVSHDLRAPLRTILSFTGLLLVEGEAPLGDAQRVNLERIQRAGERMLRLVEALLALARIGQVDVRREPVDLSAIAAAIVAELRQADPGRRVEVRIADGLTATGDRGLLQVVLDNLLRNAWKFTSRREAATIEVGEATVDARRSFFVRDDGEGFDPACADQLFRPFVRLHSGADFAGTGIGLATVARAIERHDGRVWAEGAPGKGATFWFWVP